MRKLPSKAREVQLDYRRWTTKATPAAIHAFTVGFLPKNKKSYNAR